MGIKMIEIMMMKSMQALEFDKIKTVLCEYAVSERAKKKLSELKPYLNQGEAGARLKETTEARKLFDAMGMPPLTAMKEINKLLENAEKGAMLLPEQLTDVVWFINACSRMKSYLKKAEGLNVGIAYYGDSICQLSDLGQEINLAIRNNTVEDNASKELRDIRRKIEGIKSEVKTKLDSLLRSKKEWFTDGYVSTRNGHFVLPVKKEYKNRVSGSVLDISSTGSTYFMEPDSVMKLESEISLLNISEENEVRRILYTLTALVEKAAAEIRLNMEALEALDFIFAKARLSADMNAIPAMINTDRRIHIRGGRHPLIAPENCVPLNFSIGDGTNGVIITGPNTGGKTVALKTVGLLQLMAQSGLHVPCEEAGLCMNNAVLCDIGDGQSITENLSTFSAHLSNIIHILEHADRDSLVLLDELGSGTDPAEGMGIAVAILEELHGKGCLFLATTHYPEIKEYAKETKGLVNARMAFDKESLKPLFQLEIGEAGESCALYIAKRLGLPDRMLERAYQEAYGKGTRSSCQFTDSSFLESLNKEAPKTGSSQTAVPPIVREAPEKKTDSRSMRFNVGDSVMVYPQKKLGIVYRKANEKGEVGVQIQKEKQLINHKRLKLKVASEELYPDDYDFSIIFDSVSNRKAKHKMEKGYRPDLEIVYDEKPLK